MRTSLKVAVFGAALALTAAIASPAAAQQGTTRTGSTGDRAARREQMHQQMQERRAAATQRRESMSEEQKAARKAQAEAYREKRSALMADVRAGKIDRKNAAEQLKAWREANRPARPAKP